MERPVLIKANGMIGGDLISRPIMTMDGHLLSGFWSNGACIPDKSIEKEELINELIDEILMCMKLKSKIDKDELLDVLRNPRRGSTASSKRHAVNNPPKERQRRSWGPDDTWSSRFANVFSPNKSDSKEIPKKSEKNKNDNMSSPPSKIKKRTYSKHANTESVLSLRQCQPLNRYQNRQRDDNDDEQKTTIQQQKTTGQLRKKRKELMKMMSWICDEGYEYVHTEQAKNVSEVELFLDVMISSNIPVQMTLKVNSPTDVSITYQFLPTFKEEYMILNISKTHCMVMRAF